MRILLAVIQDLYTFAVEAFLSLGRMLSNAFDEPSVTSETVENAEASQREIHTQSVPESEFSTEPVAEEVVDFLEIESEEVSTFKQVGEVFEQQKEQPEPEYTGKNTLMYVGSSEVHVYKNPTLEFDTVVGILTYGSMIMVFEQRGRWARVSCNGLAGWVLREDLADRAAYVYPEFVIGEPNHTDDPNTHRVRAMIGDMFGGAAADLPLQAGEYVAYRLLKKGIHITWPEVRPRVPGLWHKILKGVLGVHVSVAPKTGYIMEYMYTEEMGHLAYVEAVFPDETIALSEANYPGDGIYNERTLTRDEWKELRPVFIQISAL